MCLVQCSVDYSLQILRAYCRQPDCFGLWSSDIVGICNTRATISSHGQADSLKSSCLDIQNNNTKLKGLEVRIITSKELSNLAQRDSLNRQ